MASFRLCCWGTQASQAYPLVISKTCGGCEQRGRQSVLVRNSILRVVRSCKHGKDARRGRTGVHTVMFRFERFYETVAGFVCFFPVGSVIDCKFPFENIRKQRHIMMVPSRCLTGHHSHNRRCNFGRAIRIFEWLTDHRG